MAKESFTPKSTVTENTDSNWRRPHFRPNTQQEIVFRFLVMVASAVVIFAGIRAANAIVAPVFLALFLTIILIVPFRWLKLKGFSDFFALVIVIGSTVAVFLGIGWMVGNSLNDFSKQLPKYNEKIQLEVGKIEKYINNYGFAIFSIMPPKDSPASGSSQVKEKNLSEHETTGELPETEVMEPVAEGHEEPTLVQLDIEKVMGWVRWGANELRHFAESGFLVLIIALFMIFEAARFPEKVNRAFGGGPITNEHFHRIASDIRRYLLFKGGSNLISVTLVTIFYLIIGVPYALLWGLIAFFLYFIPNIGSIIAAIAPVLLVFMDQGIQGALILIVGLAIIESFIGYGLEPRILGHGLGISTVVVFLSLIFWGWILGPTGLFLAAPLTIMVKIILQAFKETEWIAILLGDNSPHASGKR